MDIYETLENGLRDVALVVNRDHPDTPIIFSHGKGQEPSRSYIVINILSVEQEGGSSTPPILNRANKLDMRVMYTALVQFSFYGSESGKLAHNFIHMINSPFVSEEMSSKNLSILSKTRLRRNPQKRETQWVDAFSFDARFNYIVNSPLSISLLDLDLGKIVVTEYQN